MASGRMAPSKAKSGRNVESTLRPDSRLAFRRQTHGTHGTQCIIFADVIPIQEYELAQWERFFPVLTQSGSALTRRTDQIPRAVDFLLNVLPSYNPE